jgi:hypothetical protein
MFLTFLSFRHLHCHFLLLSIFDQHVIATISLSPNVARLHIPFSLFLMCHSIINYLSTLIRSRYSRLFWLWLKFLLLYFFLFFLLSRFQIRLRIFFLHPFPHWHLCFSECRQPSYLFLILLPHRWYRRRCVLCGYRHELRRRLVFLLFLYSLALVVLSGSRDYHLNFFRLQIVLGGGLIRAGRTWGLSFVPYIVGCSEHL